MAHTTTTSTLPTSSTGISLRDNHAFVVRCLEEPLARLLDLELTLKHIHWNVTGPNFIAVHELLDDHAGAVRTMSDEIAERIATLGGVPNGTAKAVNEARSWLSYDLGRASADQHLTALADVYLAVITTHREMLAAVSEADPITEDLLIGQTARLELFHWFVRSHFDATTVR